MNKVFKNKPANDWNVIEFPPRKAPVLKTFDHTAAIGYIGLLLVQLNVLPAILEALRTGASAPLASILMMVAGLACYLFHSVKTSNLLYTIGNGCGLACNLVLLFAVIWRH